MQISFCFAPQFLSRIFATPTYSNHWASLSVTEHPTEQEATVAAPTNGGRHDLSIRINPLIIGLCSIPLYSYTVIHIVIQYKYRVIQSYAEWKTPLFIQIYPNGFNYQGAMCSGFQVECCHIVSHPHLPMVRRSTTKAIVECGKRCWPNMQLSLGRVKHGDQEYSTGKQKTWWKL